MAIPYDTAPAGRGHSPLVAFTRTLSASPYSNLRQADDLLFFIKRDEQGSITNFWYVPDGGPSPQAAEKGQAFGTRAAAAYTLALAQGNHCGGYLPSLDQIMTSQDFIDAHRGAGAPDNMDTVSCMAAGFFALHICRLLWVVGQHFSPADIVADAEVCLLPSN